MVNGVSRRRSDMVICDIDFIKEPINYYKINNFRNIDRYEKLTNHIQHMIDDLHMIILDTMKDRFKKSKGTRLLKYKTTNTEDEILESISAINDARNYVYYSYFDDADVNLDYNMHENGFDSAIFVADMTYERAKKLYAMRHLLGKSDLFRLEQEEFSSAIKNILKEKLCGKGDD